MKLDFHTFRHLELTSSPDREINPCHLFSFNSGLREAQASSIRKMDYIGDLRRTKLFVRDPAGISLSYQAPISIGTSEAIDYRCIFAA